MARLTHADKDRLLAKQGREMEALRNALSDAQAEVERLKRNAPAAPAAHGVKVGDVIGKPWIRDGVVVRRVVTRLLGGGGFATVAQPVQ